MSRSFGSSFRGAGGAARGNAVSRAIARVSKRCAPRPRELRKEFVRAAKEVKESIATAATSATTLSKAGARRRIRVRSSKRPRSAFVIISTARDANVIHAGRLKVSASRSGRVKSIPGANAQGAFLIGRKRFKGQHRRVYKRQAGELVAVEHPMQMQDFYKSVGAPLARKRMAAAVRRQRTGQASRMRQALGADFDMRVRLLI